MEHDNDQELEQWRRQKQAFVFEIKVSELGSDIFSARSKKKGIQRYHLSFAKLLKNESFRKLKCYKYFREDNIFFNYLW